MFKSRLQEKTQFNSRRAQNVDETLANAIRGICRRSPEVAAIYLLDLQWQGEPEMKFAIALTLDDETSQMDAVAGRFLAMLRANFPAVVDKTFIFSSRSVVERYRGYEFYLRSETPPESEAGPVIPPVDLNKPVENHALVAALQAFEESRSEQSQQELFRQLACANYLVPFFPDEMRTTPGATPGQVTIEKDSLLKIPACQDRDGKDHLPLFTDWPAIQAWLDQPVATLVMPAADAWDFILSKSHYAGAFINPGSSHLQLSREVIIYLQGAPSGSS